MPQEILRQSNFNGGELAPAAHGRRDLKAYASSLAMAENLFAMAEGPIRRRGGLRHIAMIRNKLEAVAFTAPMVTMPNGGAAANIVSGAGTVTTTALGAVVPHVIAEIDFGVPTAVGLIDLTDFAFVAVGADPAQPPSPQFPWWKNPEEWL